MWAFPDPGVTQVRFHNAASGLQILNKAVIFFFSIAAPQPRWKKDFFLGLENVFIVGRPPDKAIGSYMNSCRQLFPGEARISGIRVPHVRSSSNSPVLYLRDGNVLLPKRPQLKFLGPPHLDVTTIRSSLCCKLTMN